ncbi:DUF998 domain-containing protein [Candidatus Bathyarchaeota archaeon]|nr:DUF998 domain-containing protein [Candidatus Bathyarchaeota archaeon]
MVYANGKVAGTLFFIAATQFVICLFVSEALYPGYSIADNYISDLGVGSSAMVFNSSVFLLGLLVLIGTYFLQRAFREFKVLTVVLMLTAIGAMGVGIFTEDFGIIHTVVSLIAFLFGGLSTIFSIICSYVHKIKLVEMSFSIIAVVLGLIALGALVLFAGKIYFRARCRRNGTHDRLSTFHVGSWIWRISNCALGKNRRLSRNRSNVHYACCLLKTNPPEVSAQLPSVMNKKCYSCCSSLEKLGRAGRI